MIENLVENPSDTSNDKPHEKLLEIASEARQILKKSNRVLLVASRPIDFDCLGSTLAFAWYLDQIGVECDLVSFNKRNTTAGTFPDVKRIKFTYLNQVDFNDYDFWVLLDGGDWHQFFTKSWRQVTETLDVNRIIHVDHHSASGISNEVKLSVRRMEACTAKVVHDFFIEPEGLKLDGRVGLWIYMALVSDTGNFKHLMYRDTFDFASKLFQLGIDHNRAVEVLTPKPAMDFTVWAIQNTQYLEEIQSTVLVIGQQEREFLKEHFPSKAEENLDNYYKQIFMRLSIGYPYAIIFELADNGTKVSWRSRSGSKIEILSVMTKAGFIAGGHRNAGGGIADSTDIAKLVDEYIRLMKLYF